MSMSKQDLLKKLPSVDEALKSPVGMTWLGRFPRRFVLEGVRQAIEARRAGILEGAIKDAPGDVLKGMAGEMEAAIIKLSAPSLRPLVNATGIVMHTNLGRSPLSERAIENISAVARSYSNLEYDIDEGRRGKRHAHIRRLLRTITGAEDGIAVNNNAGAVLLSLVVVRYGTCSG